MSVSPKDASGSEQSVVNPVPTAPMPPPDKFGLLAAVGIHLPAQEKFALSFGCKKIICETPVQLRGGRHDVQKIGAFSYLGGGASQFRFIESIGRFCSIASNITAGQVQHPTHFLSVHPVFLGQFDKVWGGTPDLERYNKTQSQNISSASNSWKEFSKLRHKKITIGNDVWIGEGVTIMRGVNVGDGAVIAGKSVVTKDVPPYAVVGGIPATVKKLRFPEEVCADLLRLRWWDYGLRALEGADISAPLEAVEVIRHNISIGIPEWHPPTYSIDIQLSAKKLF